MQYFTLVFSFQLLVALPLWRGQCVWVFLHAKLRLLFLAPRPWSFLSTCPFLGKGCCRLQSCH